MKVNLYKLALGFLFALGMSGCAATQKLTTPKTPDLYPNQKLRVTPAAQADADTRNCMTMANDYIKEPAKWQKMLEPTLKGAAVGAAAGAVGGATVGAAGPGTGVGAAVGGTLGILKGLSDLNERSPSYERFVEHCLQKQGYEVIGWSSK